MLWIVYIALIISGLFLKRSKIYDFLVISFLGFLVWINTDAADYASVYLPVYENPSAGTDIDFGWIILCQIGNAVGLSYNGFSCILTILALILFWWTGQSVRANSSFMMALFLIYPGLISLVQFRQFVASIIGAAAIIIFASNCRRKYILFSLLAIIAFSIHRSAAILFALLLYIVLQSLNQLGKIIAALVIFIAGIFVLLNAKVVGFIMFGEYRTSVYLSASGGKTTAGLLGGLRNVLLIIVIAVIVFYSYRAIYRNNGNITRRKFFSINIKEYTQSIVLLNFIMIALIPFVFITNDFMRFERYGFTYALILFAMIPAASKRKKLLLPYKICDVIICLIFAIIYIANSFDSVYGALLSFEYFPQFLR